MSSKLKLSDVKLRAIKAHNGLYSYDLMTQELYDNTPAGSNWPIVCKVHGIFYQTMHNHIKGKNGCSKCSGKHKKTTEEFVIEATETHEGLYTYDFFIYKGAHVPGTITCKTHGNFEQTPANHIFGKKGCAVCAGVTPKTIDDYHELAASKNFQWVGETLPKSTKEKTYWLCPNKHKLFKSFGKLHANRLCRICAGNEPKTSSEYEALARLKNIKWLESVIPRKTGLLTQWECSNGHKWKTSYNHINRGGICRKCNRQSKGESLVFKIMGDLGLIDGVDFLCEKKFDDCVNPKTGRKLFFDFYLQKHNLLIEYDGIQHYEPCIPRNDIVEAQRRFDIGRFRDNLKNKYAEMKGINLLRIPYWDLGKIKEIITEALK